MKVVILAGGYGTRLSEYTSKIPKPMLEIGGIPMIEHIMNHYDFYGFREFIICLGYKQNIIKINIDKLKTGILLSIKNDTILKAPKDSLVVYADFFKDCFIKN